MLRRIHYVEIVVQDRAAVVTVDVAVDIAVIVGGGVGGGEAGIGLELGGIVGGEAYPVIGLNTVGVARDEALEVNGGSVPVPRGIGDGDSGGGAEKSRGEEYGDELFHLGITFHIICARSAAQRDYIMNSLSVAREIIICHIIDAIYRICREVPPRLTPRRADIIIEA